MIGKRGSCYFPGRRSELYRTVRAKTVAQEG